MKFNKPKVKNFFKKNIENFYNFLNLPVAPKKKRNLKKSKISPTPEKKFSFFKGFSKSEKYKNIFEKISQYNKEELKQEKFKNKKSSKKQKSFSLINKFAKSQKYQRFIKKFTLSYTFNLNKKKSEFKSEFSKFYSNIIKAKQYYLELPDKLKPFNLINLKLFKEDKFKKKKSDQKIGIIFYVDHNLIFLSLLINQKNNVKIDGVTEIPIPGNVIGDSTVEDSNELANIVLDSINLLDLSTSPLLVVLSSSFFNIHTFKASDLKQITQSDTKVQSKSPYLPLNTMVDFLRMSDTKISNSLIRTIYSKKDLINGWTDTLEIINLPVIGLVPAAPNIFDSITEKVIEDITILIDIESTSTTVLIGSKLAELTSHKLPFGSSLYVSDNLEQSYANYFERVLNSIILIMNDDKEKLPSDIFVMGSGLDKLLKKNMTLPKGFRKISELNLTDFSYIPKSMKIHELVSTSIDSSIYSLSTILSSCV